MNAFATARQTIVDALDAVLPGRVFPYEPPGLADGRAGGPVVWLDVALPGQRAAGAAAVNSVQFPVVITFDGADHAQVAGLDELQARLLDAVANIPRTRWVGVTVPPHEPGTNRSIIHQYEVGLAGGTFCVPTVTPDEFPPPIVRAAA